MRIEIRDKMKEKNITRYQLAQYTGSSYTTIDSIYKGRTKSINFSILQSICECLDCTPSDILILTPSEKPSTAVYVSPNFKKYTTSLKRHTPKMDKPSARGNREKVLV